MKILSLACRKCIRRTVAIVGQFVNVRVRASGFPYEHVPSDESVTARRRAVWACWRSPCN